MKAISDEDNRCTTKRERKKGKETDRERKYVATDTQKGRKEAVREIHSEDTGLVSVTMNGLFESFWQMRLVEFWDLPLSFSQFSHTAIARQTQLTAKQGTAVKATHCCHVRWRLIQFWRKTEKMSAWFNNLATSDVNDRSSHEIFLNRLWPARAGAVSSTFLKSVVCRDDDFNHRKPRLLEHQKSDII